MSTKGANNPTCPKCTAPMEPGLLADSHRDTAERILQWVRGKPDRGFLFARFKSQGRDRLKVATLRCTACGFLELFALHDTQRGAST